MTQFKTYKPNDQKLKELILYISERSEGDERFGATKLNKILFYADFLAYRYCGKPITGHPYQALPKGPAPKSLKPIVAWMTQHKELAVRTREYYGRVQHRTIALRSPNLEIFDGQEIALVDKVIKDLWADGASEISERSHAFVGWFAAREREIIPYETALVSFRQPNAHEIKCGAEFEPLAAQLIAENAGTS